MAENRGHDQSHVLGINKSKAKIGLKFKSNSLTSIYGANKG